jgi:hypothetical protein
MNPEKLTGFDPVFLKVMDPMRLSFKPFVKLRTEESNQGFL